MSFLDTPLFPLHTSAATKWTTASCTIQPCSGHHLRLYSRCLLHGKRKQSMCIHQPAAADVVQISMMTSIHFSYNEMPGMAPDWSNAVHSLLGFGPAFWSSWSLDLWLLFSYWLAGTMFCSDDAVIESTIILPQMLTVISWKSSVSWFFWKTEECTPLWDAHVLDTNYIATSLLLRTHSLWYKLKDIL